MLADATLTTLQLRNEERFQNVEDIVETPEIIKAYVLKLMPNIEIGEEPTQNLTLRASSLVFCNAGDCAIKNIKPLKGQNYITMTPFPNQRPNFRAKSIIKDGQYKVEKHSEFIATVMDNDPTNIHFTDRS